MVEEGEGHSEPPRLAKIHHAVAVASRVTSTAGRTVGRCAKKHLLAAVKHPHHYGTALGCTGLMYMIGHFEMAAVCAFWVYAFVEAVMEG